MDEPLEVRVDSEQLEIRDHGESSRLRRTVSKVALVVALSPGVTLLLGIAVTLLQSEGLSVFLALVCVVAVGSALLLALISLPALAALALLGRWRGPGTVIVGTHSLRIQRHGRHELLELDDVLEGRTGRAGACILGLAGDRTVVVPGPAGLPAEHLLQRLAAGSAVRAARFPLYPGRPWVEDLTLAGWLLVTFGLVVHGTTIGDPRPGPALLTAVLALLAFLARATTVLRPIGRMVVGADGVRIDVNGRTRLVRHGDVRGVRASARGAVLTLADGSSLSLCVAPSRLRQLLGASTSRDRLAELRAGNLASLLEARAAEHAGARPSTVTGTDSASTIDEWRSAIGSALAGLVGAYRQGSLTPAEAAAIAEDPRAAAPQRIGAALAIADAGDDEARTRVRIAADLSADDELRAALEEAAHGVLHPSTRVRYTNGDP
jgi:hypothetical protein